MFENGTATGAGGALYSTGSVNALNATFTGNSAQNGAAVGIAGGDATLTSATLASNTASNSGGGLWTNNGSTLVQDSTFQNNSASSLGAGFMAFGGGADLKFADVLFFGGSATNGGTVGYIGGGSAVTIDGSNLTGDSASGVSTLAMQDLTSSLLVTNSVIRQGGGDAFINAGGTADFINVTITGHTISGIKRVSSGGVTGVVNSIIWGNGSAFDGTPGTLTVDYSNTQGGVQAGNGNVSTNPQFIGAALVPQAAGVVDGGLGSAAVGDIFDTDGDGDVNEAAPDEAGNERIAGAGIDMGAYEFSPQPPANNDFANSSSLGGGATATGTGTNVAANTEAGEPDPTLGDCGGLTATDTVWWSWTAPGNGSVVVDTAGSSFDTVMTVYTGNSLATLTEVDCNDQASGTNQSEVSFTAAGGTTYHFRVDGYFGGIGAVAINVALTSNGPANDLFVDAVEAQRFNMGSNTNASLEQNEDTPPAISINSSVWWKWTAPTSAFTTVDTIGSNFDTVLAVWTGSSVSSLAIVATSDNITVDNTRSRTSFSAVAGTTYYFQIGGRNGEEGAIKFNLLSGATCDGQLATVAGLTGTSLADVIVGTNNADIINGLAGDDLICALDENDTVFGGDGEDTIFGGEGDDDIRGQNQTDTIYGEAGEDKLRGGDGDDEIHGGTEDDFISGQAGNDMLFGDAGEDAIRGGDDIDTMYGGPDKDFMQGGEGDDFLYGEGGNDRLSGNNGNDTIEGGDQPDRVYGGNGNDIIDGGRANDILNGQGDNDTIHGGLNNDIINGGTGEDMLYGEDGDDELRGQNDDDDLFGGDGDNDVLIGGDGADDHDGGPGVNDFCNGAVDTDTDTAVNCEVEANIP